jgi:pSer/pThr/pTyr-binding forkhead associated (FHA) protein
MSSTEAICDICGRTYTGQRCIRCTQSSISLTNFGGDTLGAVEPGSLAAPVDKPNVEAALKVTTTGALHTIATPQCIVGKAADSQIVLNGETVSDHHARISFAGGEYSIEDLGSSAGTFLNGQKIADVQVLFDGDHVRIGDFRFYFVKETAEDWSIE